MRQRTDRRRVELDAAATHAYLIAQYKLVKALSQEASAARGADSAAAAQIARDAAEWCRGRHRNRP